MDSIKISTKPLSFYHDSIRYICFEYNPISTSNLNLATDPNEHILPPIYEALLQRCFGVTHIVSTYDPWGHIPPWAQLFAEMRPERFSGFLHDLLNPGQPNFSSPFFSQITHLKILDSSWYHWSGFDQLPHLTHVSVPPFSFRKEIKTDHFTDVVTIGITRILSQCQSLRVLLIQSSDWSWSEPGNYVDIDDNRIVVLQKDRALVCNDWNTF